MLLDREMAQKKLNSWYSILTSKGLAQNVHRYDSIHKLLIIEDQIRLVDIFGKKILIIVLVFIKKNLNQQKKVLSL